MGLLVTIRREPRVSELESRVDEVVRENGLDTVVATAAGSSQRTEALARAVDGNLVAIDVDPRRLERVEAARQVLGRSPRAIADVRHAIPPSTLWFLSAQDDVGEAIFHIPRGEGVIAVEGGDERAVRDQLVRWSPNHRLERFVDADGATVLFAFPQRRTHVTFLIEKYTHKYGQSGISINLDNLVATLHQTGLASYDVVHYDERFHEGPPLEARDLAMPGGADGHAVVFVCHYHSAANPSVAMLEAAKAAGSKIIGVWLDKRTSVSTPEYAEVADINVVLDGNDFELPNAWPIFTPKNPQFFFDPGGERDIDVSFVGESRYLPQRRAFLQRLEAETRIRAKIIGSSASDTKRQLSIREYAEVFQRSKISVALTMDSVKQLKGRVFEAIHCGAMLMCDINPYINTYLRPGVEYVPFHDYEDLVEKCAYYLAHEDEMEAVRRAGHAKVVKYYSSSVFWRSLLARAGLLEGTV